MSTMAPLHWNTQRGIRVTLGSGPCGNRRLWNGCCLRLKSNWLRSCKDRWDKHSLNPRSCWQVECRGSHLCCTSNMQKDGDQLKLWVDLSSKERKRYGKHQKRKHIQSDYPRPLLLHTFVIWRSHNLRARKLIQKDYRRC